MGTKRERELVRELNAAFDRIDELESFIESGQELLTQGEELDDDAQEQDDAGQD